MKNYILLLFIPIVCFCQTYEDIISIDSEEQFIKIATENGFSLLNNDKGDLIIMQKMIEKGVNDSSFNITASFMTQPISNSKFGLKIDYKAVIRDTLKRFYRSSLDFSSIRDNLKKNCSLRKKKLIHKIREGQKNPYEKITYENVSDLGNYKKVVESFFCYECPGLNGWIGLSYSSPYKTSIMVVFN